MLTIPIFELLYPLVLNSLPPCVAFRFGVTGTGEFDGAIISLLGIATSAMDDVFIQSGIK